MNADRRQRLAEDARGARRRRPLRALHRRARRAAADDPQPLPGDRPRRCRPTEVAAAWLRAQGVAEPEVLLAGCGGQPQDVLALAQLGRRRGGLARLAGQGAPRATSRRCAAGPCRWRSTRCRSSATTPPASPRARRRAISPPRRCRAAPRRLAALLRWARALRRVAEFAEHPWNAELSLESLVEQGREALQTPRSAQRRGEVDSVHLRR